jgi:hypothetical protein
MKIIGNCKRDFKVLKKMKGKSNVIEHEGVLFGK